MDPLNFPLPDAFKGCTWPGLTWTVTAVDDGDTEFAAALVSAKFQMQDSSGNAILTLSSAVSGEVTLNATTANAWSITVEGRIMTAAAGNYTYALETTDADGIVSPRMSGTIRVNPDPTI
jgi:hypothetical protein